MDHYKLYRPDRESLRSKSNWVVHLVQVLAAVGFVLVLMYLFR